MDAHAEEGSNMFFVEGIKLCAGENVDNVCACGFAFLGE